MTKHSISLTRILKPLSLFALLLTTNFALATTMPAMQHVNKQKNQAAAQNKAQQQEQAISYSNPKKPIMISRDKHTFTITLKANRTTGYTWYLSRMPARAIKLVEHRYVAPNKAMPGVPGYVIWKFRAKPIFTDAPHFTKIKFIYAQAWNMKDKKSVKFKVFSQ